MIRLAPFTCKSLAENAPEHTRVTRDSCNESRALLIVSAVGGDGGQHDDKGVGTGVRVSGGSGRICRLRLIGSRYEFACGSEFVWRFNEDCA